MSIFNWNWFYKLKLLSMYHNTIIKVLERETSYQMMGNFLILLPVCHFEEKSSNEI